MSLKNLFNRLIQDLAPEQQEDIACEKLRSVTRQLLSCFKDYLHWPIGWQVKHKELFRMETENKNWNSRCCKKLLVIFTSKLKSAVTDFLAILGGGEI